MIALKHIAQRGSGLGICMPFADRDWATTATYGFAVPSHSTRPGVEEPT